MKLLRGFEDPVVYRGGFFSIGNFDGVHRGHQSMLRTLVELARVDGVPAGVLTFDPHPVALLRPDHAPPSLSTLDRKAELMERCGIDFLIAYPTDQALLHLAPDDFFKQIVLVELNARGLVEGPNFHFGHNRAGDVELLLRLCDQHGLMLEVVPPVEINGQMVSSSVIRERIRNGQIREAIELLGHPYRVCGRVTSGAVRGRELGFPTANLEDVPTLLPRDGVYAGVSLFENERYPAAIHVGPSRTFRETERKLEVHLVGFSGEIYGQTLTVDFLERLRDSQSFDHPETLRMQIQQDITRARQSADSFESGQAQEL